MSHRSLTVSARAQLRSIAKASAVSIGTNRSASGSSTAGSASANSATAAAAAAAGGATVPVPPPPTNASATSSSDATVAVTPMPMPTLLGSAPFSLSGSGGSVEAGVIGSGRIPSSRSGASGGIVPDDDTTVSRERDGLAVDIAPLLAGVSTTSRRAAERADTDHGDESLADDEGDDDDATENGEPETGCGGAGVGNPDDPSRSMGPALTSEAAGLSDLIRRRGGLAALSDGRAVAAVLRAAAPRRQNAFHRQRASGFFDAEATDEAAGSTALTIASVSSLPGFRRGGGVSGSGGSHGGEGGALRLAEDGAGEDRGEVAGRDSGAGIVAVAGLGSSTYVSTTCSGFFGTTKLLAVRLTPCFCCSNVAAFCRICENGDTDHQNSTCTNKVNISKCLLPPSPGEIRTIWKVQETCELYGSRRVDFRYFA